MSLSISVKFFHPFFLVTYGVNASIDKTSVKTTLPKLVVNNKNILTGIFLSYATTFYLSNQTHLTVHLPHLLHTSIDFSMLFESFAVTMPVPNVLDDFNEQVSSLLQYLQVNLYTPLCYIQSQSYCHHSYCYVRYTSYISHLPLCNMMIV